MLAVVVVGGTSAWAVNAAAAASIVAGVGTVASNPSLPPSVKFVGWPDLERVREEIKSRGGAGV